MSYTAKPKQRSAGISKTFLMRVSWSKIQLFGFTEQLPAMEQVFLRGWQTKLDQFLKFNDRDVLEGAGKISKKVADEKACSEYIEFEKKAAPAERSRG